MRLYLSVGDPSGDMHGADLARALHERAPTAELLGMGGPLMRAAGVKILFDPVSRSTIGFFEALTHLGRYRRLLREVVAFLAAHPPDAVVWIDFGGFNLTLAGHCRRLGIPVVCLFSPSAWAYARGRARLMAQRVTELAAVFPFEAVFYRSYGLRVTFVGHPLLDRVRAATDPAAFRREMGVGEEEILLALLPGSRRQEIARLLPVMLEAAGLLLRDRPGLRLILPRAASIPEEVLTPYLARADLPLRILAGRTYDVLAAADVAAIASGTATLEAALLGTPMVSIYRVSPLSAFLYRLLRNREQRGRPPSTALPNLVLGRRLVPELLQEELNGRSLAAELALLLDRPARREEMRAGLREVRQALGSPGAMGRVAEIVLRVAKEKNGSQGEERG
ncbi:MAG: lipid-A-disaccharide synthase [Firmicutes bacterium]|nr:lipid-A-disaccharide synthase [Bacillota bacterium]